MPTISCPHSTKVSGVPGREEHTELEFSIKRNETKQKIDVE
jgi:hypothetical protein